MKTSLLVILLGLVGFLIANSQIPQINSRLTSDASQVRGGMPIPPMPNNPIFVPPNDMMIVMFHTSTIPIIVRVEVSSNVWRRSLWWHNGQPQTNDTLIASNLISATTNVVQ